MGTGNPGRRAFGPREMPSGSSRGGARLYPRILLFFASLIVLAACSDGGGGGGEGGGGGSTSPSIVPRFAYVANQLDDSVSTYVVDAATGRLKFIGKAATGIFPFSVALHPSGQYAYVANLGTSSVSQYTIGADGSLTPMANPSANSPSSPRIFTVDPTGSYAYAAYASGVSQYTIGADGSLAQNSPSFVTAETLSSRASPTWRIN